MSAVLPSSPHAPLIGKLLPVLVHVDDAFELQPEIRARMAVVLDVRDLHEPLRFGPNARARDELERRFRATFGTAEGKMIFYGASDYHELTRTWIGALDPERPVSVVHFDNHTDAFGKSGWPSQICKMPHVKRLIQFGVDGDMRMGADAPFPITPFTVDYKLQLDGIAEVYPTSMRVSHVWGWMRADLQSVRFRPRGLATRCEWRSLNVYGVEAIVNDVCDRLPTDDVYITIDKDAIRPADCFTNYYPEKQGNLTADDLIRILDIVRTRKNVIAMDVTGDASHAVLTKNSMRDLFHRGFYRYLKPEYFDRDDLRQRNVELNERLLALFCPSRLDAPAAPSAPVSGVAS